MCFVPQWRAIFHLCTCHFSEPTFRPSGATKHLKDTVFYDFFRALWSSFFWLVLFSDFFSLDSFSSLTSSLLTLSLLCLFPPLLLHLSILSEVWLLNFLRQLHCLLYVEIVWNCRMFVRSMEAEIHCWWQHHRCPQSTSRNDATMSRWSSSNQGCYKVPIWRCPRRRSGRKSPKADSMKHSNCGRTAALCPLLSMHGSELTLEGTWWWIRDSPCCPNPVAP